MTDQQQWIDRKLGFFPIELRRAIGEASTVHTIPPDTEILREGQYVKVIPIVVEGLIKVLSRFEDRELLLYYIQPEESCIMSFAAVLENTPSRIFAVTEEASTVLLLPSQRINEWIRQYPTLNLLFYQQYRKRYEDLLQTVQSVLFDSMDSRILNYLQDKARLKQTRRLELRHRAIAADLGTAREVVTRVLKKLEKEKLVLQLPGGIIEIL